MKHIHITHEENWKGELFVLFFLLSLLACFGCTSNDPDPPDPIDDFIVKDSSKIDSSQLKNTIYVQGFQHH